MGCWNSYRCHYGTSILTSRGLVLALGFCAGVAKIIGESVVWIKKEASTSTDVCEVLIALRHYLMAGKVVSPALAGQSMSDSSARKQGQGDCASRMSPMMLIQAWPEISVIKSKRCANGLWLRQVGRSKRAARRTKSAGGHSRKSDAAF